jgi:hypothetical protein
MPCVCLGGITDKCWYDGLREWFLKAAVVHLRWNNTREKSDPRIKDNSDPLSKDKSGSRTRIPLVSEKSREETRFTRPILQIVFPLTQDVEDLPGTLGTSLILIREYFAVRTETELDILTCSKSEDPAPILHRRIRLPSPLADDPTAKYIADATLSPHSPRAACIADSGFWAVHNFQPRKETHKLESSGRIITAGLMTDNPGVRWWKIEWNEVDNILVMENLGLYLLDVNVDSQTLSWASSDV